MEKQQLISLLKGWVQQTLTSEELRDLEAFLSDKNHMELFADAGLDVLGTTQPLPAFDERLLPILQRALDIDVPAEVTQVNSEAPVHRVHFLRKWGWAAASILLIISVSAYLFSVLSSSRSTTHTDPSIALTQDIAPGTDGAILTLADGSQVSLDTIKNATVAMQGGSIAKVVNGVLAYESNGKEVVYNTMSTPKGRQFPLVLPDGTKVWLNSASSIRFPTVFKGKERRVEIHGEAYFEVARNEKMPFRVDVHGKETIEVLGTQFNINAYGNEPSINTTLIEGSVAISLAAEGSNQRRLQSVILKPGQQAQLKNPGSAERLGKQAGQEITVENNADIEKVIAWKKGLFNFEGADVEMVMRQLERWYDITVVYEKGVPPIKIGGKMGRDISLSGVLEILEGIGLRVRMEGRTLIVLQ